MNNYEDKRYETSLFDICSSNISELEIKLKADIEKQKQRLCSYAINKNNEISNKQWRYALNCLKSSTRLLSEITNNPKDKETAIKINSVTLKGFTTALNEVTEEDNIEKILNQLLFSSTPVNTIKTEKNNKTNIIFDKSIIDDFKECEVSVKTEKGKQKIIFSFLK